MKSFRSFIVSLRKKYVALHFDETSNYRLRRYAMDNGFDLTLNFDNSIQHISDFNFHTTIFFTTSEHDTREGEYDIEPINVSFTSLDMLGENKDIPVLKVEKTHELLAIRNRFELIGYKDAWPEYKPHVTLSYNRTDKVDIEKVPLPDFTVSAVKIKIENQK